MWEVPKRSLQVTTVQKRSLETVKDIISHSLQKEQNLLPLGLAQLCCQIQAGTFTQGIGRGKVGVVSTGREVVVAESSGRWVPIEVE